MVEPEISSLALILCFICNPYPNGMTVMITIQALESSLTPYWEINICEIPCSVTQPEIKYLLTCNLLIKLVSFYFLLFFIFFIQFQFLVFHFLTTVLVQNQFFSFNFIFIIFNFVFSFDLLLFLLLFFLFYYFFIFTYFIFIFIYLIFHYDSYGLPYTSVLQITFITYKLFATTQNQLQQSTFF